MDGASKPDGKHLHVYNEFYDHFPDRRGTIYFDLTAEESAWVATRMNQIIEDQHDHSVAKTDTSIGSHARTGPLSCEHGVVVGDVAAVSSNGVLVIGKIDHTRCLKCCERLGISGQTGTAQVTEADSDGFTVEWPAPECPCGGPAGHVPRGGSCRLP